MKFSKYIFEQSQSTNSLKDGILEIIKKNNLWKEADDPTKDIVKQNAKTEEKFEMHKKLVESFLISLKNASDSDFQYFRENENELTEYENLLLEILYKDDNSKKTVLENYFKEIDQIAISKISSPSQPTQATSAANQTTTGTATPTRNLSEKLTPEENEKLIKKLEEMGFEL